MTSVPRDAAAIDVSCPLCGERPIEQAASAYRIAGILLPCWVTTRTHVGCGRCTRRKCWRTAARTALTGWWSVTCIPINPFAISWDVGRGLYNRGPPDGIVSALEKLGFPVTFLDDPADFEDSGDVHEGVFVQGLVQLGCGVALAVGDPEDTEFDLEADAICDHLATVVDGIEEAELASLIEATLRADPSIDDVSTALGVLLSIEGRDSALNLVTRVASVDGEIDEEAIALILEVGDGVDRPIDADEIEMMVVLNRILFVEGHESYVGVEEAELNEFE